MAIKDRFKNIPLPEIVEEPLINENVSGNSPDTGSIYADLIKTLSQKIASIPVWFEYTKDEQHTLVSSYVNTKLCETGITFSDEEKENFVSLFLNSVYGFGALDFLIVRDDISSIFVNAKGIVEIEKNGAIELSDIVIDEKQFNKIKEALIKASGSDKASGMINLKIEHLLITMLLPPVCEPKIVIKKLSRRKFDFEYLNECGMLTKPAIELIKSYISEKKNILITGKIDSGKSALLSAIVNELADRRCALLQEFAMIKPEGLVETFSAGSLKEGEFEKLISTIVSSLPEYIFADLNFVKYTDFIMNALSGLNGFISTVRANSVVSAVVKLASAAIYSEKCTEKTAKANIAKVFDYIIHIDDCKLVSITSLSLNKAGSLMLTDVEIPEEITPYPYPDPLPDSLASLEAHPLKDYSSFRSRFQ